MDIDAEETTSTSLAELQSGSAAMVEAEISMLVATARRYPRNVRTAAERVRDIVTLDEIAAEESIYSLPRAGQALEGPSIRFAETVAQNWGNNRVAARTVEINKAQKYVEAEGIFLDAETNAATLSRVRRPIVTRQGRLFNDDMIIMTCNAAQAIARRNAILAGVPKPVWRVGYEAARQTIMGDIKMLANRRAEAIRSFQRFGVTAEQLYAQLGVKTEEEITQDHLVSLRAAFSSIRNKDITVEQFLGKDTPAVTHDTVENPLAKKRTSEKAAPAGDDVSSLVQE